jgi:hypothetical protein
MARIRTVKPEFWTHEALSGLPEATHLLAAALINYADDHGYFNANPALVLASCSPLREPSVTIPESLRSLQEIGYIEIGTCEKGRRYGRIIAFREHQRVSHPTPSKIECLSITWGDSGNAPEIFVKPPEVFRPEQGTGNRERKGTGKGNTSSDAVRDVFAYWQAVMGKPGTILTPKRDRAVTAALKLGYTTDQIKSAIDGCKRSPFHMGMNDQRTVYDDLELICRSGENIEKFIHNIGAGSGVETIDMTKDRIQAQADRVAAYLEDVSA